MRNSEINKSFIDSLPAGTRNTILFNIAEHYGIKTSEAYEEIIDEDAECILDYITGVTRNIVFHFYQKFINESA